MSTLFIPLPNSSRLPSLCCFLCCLRLFFPLFSCICLTTSFSYFSFQRLYPIMSVMTVKVSSLASILFGYYWIMFVFSKPKGEKKAQLNHIAKCCQRHSVMFLFWLCHSQQFSIQLITGRPFIWFIRHEKIGTHSTNSQVQMTGSKLQIAEVEVL